MSIAFQVVGEGPFDLVYIPGAVSHVDHTWDDPLKARYFQALATGCRLILFDKRGTGASDPEGVADLETRIDDVRAVMDAAGSARAAVMGVSEGGPMSLLFAALHPTRVAALVLYGTLPRFLWAPDFPWGQPQEEWDREIEDTASRWGTVELAREWLGPSAPEDRAELMARSMRMGASPGSYRQLERTSQQFDVREILPSVAVPTLVLHRTEDEMPIAGARWMATQIPGATFVELSDGPHFPFLGDWQAIATETHRFLADVRDRGDWDDVEAEPDRLLTTVLFTDIVGSSATAAEVGDRAWADLVTEHHRRVRARLARFRGREIDTAGDGFFASFDGPARAIRCAETLTKDLAQIGLTIRAGIHTGECEVANGKITGIAVNIGARVAAQAEPNQVLVSQTVRDLVAGSGIAFDDGSEEELKGIPGRWRLYAVRET